jgi:hypothetical protein
MNTDAFIALVMLGLILLTAGLMWLCVRLQEESGA